MQFTFRPLPKTIILNGSLTIFAFLKVILIYMLLNLFRNLIISYLTTWNKHTFVILQKLSKNLLNNLSLHALMQCLT